MKVYNGVPDELKNYWYALDEDKRVFATGTTKELAIKNLNRAIDAGLAEIESNT